MQAQNARLPEEFSGLRFLNAAQVLEVLDISKTTLYGLMKRAKDPIPNVRIGRSRRFPLDKLRWWMENLNQ